MVYIITMSLSLLNALVFGNGGNSDNVTDIKAVK